MRVEENDIDGLYVERRTYDDNNKLVRIDKVIPPHTHAKGVARVKFRSGGASE